MKRWVWLVGWLVAVGVRGAGWELVVPGVTNGVNTNSAETVGVGVVVDLRDWDWASLELRAVAASDVTNGVLNFGMSRSYDGTNWPALYRMVVPLTLAGTNPVALWSNWTAGPLWIVRTDGITNTATLTRATNVAVQWTRKRMGGSGWK